MAVDTCGRGNSRGSSYVLRAAMPDPATFKGVYQSRTGNGNGNCFAACVATILGVELDEMPPLYASLFDGDKAEFCRELRAWLHGRGLDLEQFTVDERVGPPAGIGWWIAELDYNDREGHAVVFYNYDFIWDPYPDRGKLWAHPEHTITRGWKLVSRYEALDQVWDRTFARLGDG